jgi:putative ABC transport system permease protein
MLSLALAYLRDRGFVTAFNIILVALGVAALALLLLLSHQLEQRFTKDAQGIDLVVGAKGSPLQLVLSAVYHLDTPTGNIPTDALALLRADPGVARVVPLALGDNFRGFRIVGTEAAFLSIQDTRLASGEMFANVGDAVVGAVAARETGLTIGQKFVGTHGLSDDGHEATPFVVTGILAPTGTVTDRLILTSVESVWAAHGIAVPGADPPPHAHEEGHHHHHDVAQPATATLDPRAGPAAEHTALLVTYRNAMAAVRLPGTINRETQYQAAAPAIETARLLSLFGSAVDGARLFAWLLALTGGLSLFVVLLSHARTREGDLALLRVMGATRLQAAGLVLTEAALIAGAGVILGLVAAHMLLGLGGLLFPTLASIGVSATLFHPGELAIAAAVLGIGLVSALLPAWRVYHQDLAPILARTT